MTRRGACARFTNALFCTLARGDTVAARSRMAEYATLDYTFEGTREWVLVEALVKACEEYDTQGFADGCAEYDKSRNSTRGRRACCSPSSDPSTQARPTTCRPRR